MKNLFKSGTAYEILGLLSAHPKQSYYLNELVKALNKDAANVTRELAKLEKEGVVAVEEKQEKKFYRFNTDYPSARELKKILATERSTSLEEKFDTTWLLAEDIPNMDPFFAKMWMDCFVDEFEQPGGRAYAKIAAIFKDYHLWFYYDKADAQEVAGHLVSRFIESPAFMDEINTEIVKHSDTLRAFAEGVPEQNLEKLSNRELWQLYKEHEDIHTAYYQWGWIPVAADMFTDSLTEEGKKILRGYDVSEEEINDYLAKLTLPATKSLIKQEQESLQDIAIMVQKDSKQQKLFDELMRKFKEEDVKQFDLYAHSPEYEAQFEERVRDLISTIDPNISSALQDHYATYFYTKFIFTEEQGVYSFEYYLKELVRLVSGGGSVAELREREEVEDKAAQEERTQLLKKLELSKEHEQIFAAWGEFMVTKIYRRFAQLFALYKMVAPLEEIARRLNLSLKETKFALSQEIERGLSGEALDIDHIKSRVPFSVYYTTRDGQNYYVGQEAQRAAEFIQKEDIEDVHELTGQVGATGHAVGTVKIVNFMEDMEKMEEGDILVAISTQPDLLPAMKKAAAFVTEQGGVTSHAAIVAREMKTPCVIGTKIATKVLKDGDKVEVDATKGIVRKLS